MRTNFLGLSAGVRARGLEPVGFSRLVRAVLAGGLRSLSEFVLPPQRLLPVRRPTSPYEVRSAARPRASIRQRQGGSGPH